MTGKVYLIGAGPGDPDLLTVKAARILQSADVVLHDSLVSPEVLALVSPRAEVVHIGKRAGRKLLTQDEINAVLVHYARSKSVVVRLKGGDPLIFGRASEEIDALRAAGVPLEIVPGISSSLAAAAAAGVSLTDRRRASQVLFTTAHQAPGKTSLDWTSIAAGNTTIVVYMTGSDYGRLGSSLAEAGLDAATPCLVVSCASRPEQQMRWTSLHRLGDEPALPAPALIIVGKVATSSAALADSGIWDQIAASGLPLPARKF